MRDAKFGMGVSNEFYEMLKVANLQLLFRDKQQGEGKFLCWLEPTQSMDSLKTILIA